MDYGFNDVSAYDGFSGSPDGLGFSMNGFGADEAPIVMADSRPAAFKSALAMAYGVASIAGAGIGAYHGYRRNDSVGWAIVWSLLGAIAPVIVIPVAYAQGIGERR